MCLNCIPELKNIFLMLNFVIDGDKQQKGEDNIDDLHGWDLGW